MPRTPITRTMLKKHKGDLRKYYLEGGELASERAANMPGGYSDIPESDIRSIQIAERLYQANTPVKEPKKKKKKLPTFKEYGSGVKGLIKTRLAKYEEALGR